MRDRSIPKGNVPNALIKPFRIELTRPKCLVTSYLVLIAGSLKLGDDFHFGLMF
jgi:hypothetical protein